MNNYNLIIEQRSKNCALYTFADLNAKGEKIQFELSRCGDGLENCKNSLPYLWKKNGYINRVLPNYWCVSVYATESNGNCWGWYNPQTLEYTRTIKDGKTLENRHVVNRHVITRHIINFDYMLEATEENKQKLIDEIYKRAFVTFEKVRKA